MDTIFNEVVMADPNVPKVVTSMGGFVTSQDPDYVEKFLKNILNVTKGNKTLKEIRSDFNKKEVA